MGVGGFQIELPTWNAQWSGEALSFFGIMPAPNPPPTFDGFLQFVESDDRAPLQQWFHDCAEGVVVPTTEFRIRRPGMQSRWLLAFAVLEKSSDGRPARLNGAFQEITAQKDAEEDLRVSEENIRVTLQSIGDAVIATDENGRVNRMNATAETLTGWNELEAVGRPLSEIFKIISAETGESCPNPADLVMKHGEVVGLANHTTLISRNGRPFQIADSAAPIRDPSGSIRGVVLVFHDVTESYHLQQKLVASEARFRTIFEQAAVGVFQVEAQTGRFVQVNRRFTEIIAYPPEEILGRTFQSITHPDDLQIGEESLARFLRGEIREVMHEKRYIRKDGKVVWVSLAVSSTWGPGEKPSYNIGVVQDITQEKESALRARESSEKWRRLVDILPVGVTILDANRRVMDMNPAIEAMTEMTKEELESGAYKKRQYISSDGSPITLDDFPSARAITRQETIEHVETGVVLEDGRTIWFDVSAAPLPFEDAACVVVSVDITQRKQNEETMRRTQRMEAMGQLTGGIAHDFNNQLGIILGNVELLEAAENLESAPAKRVHGIRMAADRAAQLTRQLLGFARGQPARTSLVDVRQYLTDMDSLISRSLTAEIAVSYEFDPDLWPTLIDAGDFEDAVLNLLLNARDAMPTGGRIRVQASNWVLDEGYCAIHPGVKPGEYVQVAVTDSGEGIPREIISRIFEPFFTTRAHGAGTGLGLAMVFGFVRRSNGHISVYSERGIGSTFRIFLPRARGVPEQPSRPILPSPKLPRGSEKVLIAEDEEGLLDLAFETLNGLGYQVITAKTGVEALRKLTADPMIPILFTDVVMPGGMNGYELAEKALQISPGIKLLITSGYAEKRSGLEIEHPQMRKPYRQSELAERIRAILDGQEGR